MGIQIRAFNKGVTYLTFLINNSNFNSANFELYLKLYAYAMHCTTMFFAEVEICVREKESEFNIFRDDVET